jgi:hypothetical protein
MRARRTLVRAVARIGTTASLIAGCLALTTSPAGAASTLHSPRWLREHCSIAVDVNVFAPGGNYDSKSGVSVRGKAIDGETPANPSAHMIVKYAWHVSQQDHYCGIVGAWSGPEYRSLQPTSLTTHGGTYTDYSQGIFNNGEHEVAFIVYARPARVH